MGIPGLPALIKSVTDDEAIKLHSFKHFRGMTVAVDTSILVHKISIGVRSSGKDMTNLEGGLTSHLNGIFYKILFFLENNMTPIFVFDGKPPDLKNRTLNKRKECKIIASDKLKTTIDEEEYVKCFQKSFTPTKNDYLELQIMLDLIGIPYVQAPGEADPVLAWLALRKDKTGNRYVKGVCSNDTDVLTLGAPYMFKNMFESMSKTSNEKVSVISLRATLAKMEFDMDQFVDLCTLMGCDYCERIKTVGPKKSYNLIRSKKNLEGAINQLKIEATKNDKIIIDKKNIKCMFEANKYFKNVLNDLDNNDDFVITEDNLKLRSFQYDELIDFMCVKHNFDVIKIQSMIKRLSIYYGNMNITRPNNKKVHKILKQRSEDYAFLSSESSEDNGPIIKKKYPSKK